ncbi:MAG TPA: histidinol dehydrogenase [Candidatus Binatia bacterium]|nr:histidinol dehydrogenase [Candidatus Binatia bacterium]
MNLVVRTTERRFAALRRKLARRGAVLDASVEPAVRAIVDDVRRRGDRAVAAATWKFDRVRLKPRERVVERPEMEEACRALAPADLRALRLAARRIRAFHERQRERSFRYRDPLGVRLGQEIRPLCRVGLYIPGGTAFYPSSVLMNAIPARVAGVRDVVAVSPPHAGGEPPALLAAAAVAGVDRLHRVGGAQAVAALAYGTETIARVDKIVGPGNVYVATAKRLVAGTVAIDMIAGPSEVLVIADGGAKPELVAADLLAQAEHDADATAICLTPSARVAAAVERALDVQLAALGRAEIARRSLRAHGAIVVTRSLDEAIELANEIAPEHLELAVRDPERWVARLHHAGAIFLGHTTPEAFGDYLAGPNHVLPTGGTARFSSPLGVYDFVKRTSVIEAPPRALARLAPPLLRLAAMEGLSAHGAAVERRLDGRRPAGR